jgi:hypothetical protein
MISAATKLEVRSIADDFPVESPFMANVQILHAQNHEPAWLSQTIKT